MKTDREQFFRYTRMSSDRFHHLLGLVEEKISKKDTQFRKAISPEERLIITVRYLATGHGDLYYRPIQHVIGVRNWGRVLKL